MGFCNVMIWLLEAVFTASPNDGFTAAPSQVGVGHAPLVGASGDVARAMRAGLFDRFSWLCHLLHDAIHAVNECVLLQRCGKAGEAVRVSEIVQVALDRGVRSHVHALAWASHAEAFFYSVNIVLI